MRKVVAVLIVFLSGAFLLQQQVRAVVMVPPTNQDCPQCPGSQQVNSVAVQQAPPLTGTVVGTAIPLSLQEKALARVEKRIADLLAEVDKIAQDTDLTDATKNELTSQIQTVISMLNALKTKIGQDQTDASIRQDFAQVLSQKVYVCFLPKVILTVSDDRLIALVKNLSGMAEKTKALIDSLQSQGVDTSQFKPLLVTLEQELNAAQSSLASASTQLPSLTPPNNCTQNKGSIVSQLSHAKQLLVQINKLITQLQQLIGGVRPSGTVSGVPVSSTPIPPGCYYKQVACPMIACRVGGPCPTCTPQLICPSGGPIVTPVPPPGCYYAPGGPCPCTGKICPMCYMQPRLVCPSGTPQPTCQPEPLCLRHEPFCYPPVPVGGWCPVTGGGTPVVAPRPTCTILPCKPGVRCSVPIGC